MVDKDFLLMIYTVRLYSDHAHVYKSLKELYDLIPETFGINKKIYCKDENRMIWNKDWFDAKDWINYTAGWEIIEGKVRKHKIRVLKEKFEGGNI